MSDQGLYQQVKSALKDRGEWEEKVRTWYKLRHGLIPRKKPYPGAPDQKARLIDASIDKHKPFYVQQLYALETLAQFVPTDASKAEQASSVAAWFDYQLKQKSNFPREAMSAIDSLLESGGCPVKVRWDDRASRIDFEAIDPMMLIVPKGTEEIQHADWLVHVLRMSEAQYRKNKSYTHDDELIKRLKGRGNGNNTAKEQDQDEREGITYGRDDEIVLWECYTRDESNGDKITVKTRSPLCFDENTIRADFGMPYDNGVFSEGWFPFNKWRPEIIAQKDYYASRGHAEILAPYEVAMSKAWNYKLEHMDYHSRPMFEQEVGAQCNLGNFKPGPGAFIPAGIRAAISSPVPPALAEEMNFVRQMAEYRIAAPDFTVTQDDGGKRTATEINAISGQTGQGTDLKARIFRLDLADTYRMAWAILLQFAKESLSFVIDGEIKSVDGSAMSDDYEVMPNGSADSWNKGQQFAKAQNRFQMLRGDAYINQGELRKDLLASDEPGSIKRLYVEPQDAQNTEYEDQAVEILVMNEGLPAKVDPADDDKTHLLCLTQYVEQAPANGKQITPRDARLYLKHGADHDAALEQKKDPQLAQIRQKTAPITQILGAIAQQTDPREMANVVPMQPAGAPQAAPDPATANDSAKQVPALMQGLASLKKAGVPITYDDINAVLHRAGLPPLQASPPFPAVTASPQPTQPAVINQPV